MDIPPPSVSNIELCYIFLYLYIHSSGNEQSEVPLRTVQRRNPSPEMGEFQSK